MKTKKIWPIILIVIIIATAAGVILFNSTDTARFRKQLNLGQRYLSEMNYEEAVVAFNQAIEIDPRSVDAYLGLADAYVGLGDEEAALAALKKGYEATGDERLKARIDEMEAERESVQETEQSADGAEAVGENPISIEEIEEIYKIVNLSKSSSGEEHVLTYEQREIAFRPIIETLEVWLKYEPEDEFAWEDFAQLYLQLGEMEKCLEVRSRGYEATGWKQLMPNPHEDDDGNTYDEYGRIINSVDGDVWAYGEADRQISLESDDRTWQLEYDNQGRISKSTSHLLNGSGDASWNYEYDGANQVVIHHLVDGQDEGYFETLIYDEYGRVIERKDSLGEVYTMEY